MQPAVLSNIHPTEGTRLRLNEKLWTLFVPQTRVQRQGRGIHLKSAPGRIRCGEPRTARLAAKQTGKKPASRLKEADRLNQGEIPSVSRSGIADPRPITVGPEHDYRWY